MIGARPGDHMIAKLLGERRDFGMNPRVRGRRRAHNAARVIAAGGDRVEQHLVQPLDGGADILLQHPMELEGLARRQTERVARSEEHTYELTSPMRSSYDI